MYYFFPNNHMWSQAALRMLFTGGSIGEVAPAIEQLASDAATADPEAWFRVWHASADRLWQRAEEQRALGHDLSARGSYLRCSAYEQWAGAFLEHDDQRRHASHRRSIDAFQLAADRFTPRVERVEVPYLDGSFPAWYVPPATGQPGPAPSVFFLPGWDSTKEQGFELALAIAARGVGVLLCDGPGIGEAVLYRGLVNRYDYEVPGSAAFDYLASRPDVDANRIAVVGSSMGGYRAARVASFEHRLAGAVVWGAIWDFGATWRRSLQQPGETLPTRSSHALHVMGAESLDEVTALMKDWTLDGVAGQIACPLLILHGERDIQIPVSDAEHLHQVAQSSSKELKVFTVEEGGSAHCQNDHRLLAHDYIGDWLEDVLLRGRERSGIIRGTVRE